MWPTATCTSPRSRWAGCPALQCSIHHQGLVLQRYRLLAVGQRTVSPPVSCHHILAGGKWLHIQPHRQQEERQLAPRHEGAALGLSCRGCRCWQLSHDRANHRAHPAVMRCGWLLLFTLLTAGLPVPARLYMPARLQLPDGTELESLTVEARIQAPAPGKGLWGAFWAFPVDAKYGRWPASGQVRHTSNGNACWDLSAGGHSHCCSVAVLCSCPVARSLTSTPYNTVCRLTSWQRSTP